jgi:hypothetical protein
MSSSDSSTTPETNESFVSSALTLWTTVQSMSIKEVVRNGIGMTIFAIFGSIATGIVEIGQLFTQPVDALGAALVEVVNAFLIRPLGILVQGAQTSIASIMPGAPFDLGPFTWWLALAVFLVGAWAVGRFLTEEETSNVLPGAPFDLSIPGFREEEDSRND